jgi:hypothetical protein
MTEKFQNSMQDFLFCMLDRKAEFLGDAPWTAITFVHYHQIANVQLSNVFSMSIHTGTDTVAESFRPTRPLSNGREV